MKVLSIRQPWAALILCGKPGWKNIENRTWPTDFRGWFYIHAAKTPVSATEWKMAMELALHAGVYVLPRPEGCKRGGIVGMARITDCVRRHRSPWFAGPFGFVLADPEPWPFEPCAGQLGFFDYGQFPAPHRPKYDE